MNEYANPTLDYSFVTVFTASGNEDLLIKFFNDLLQPDDDEQILEVKKGPNLYPASKTTSQLTTFDVFCQSKTRTVIVQVQLRHVYHNFVKYVQTSAVWRYYSEDEHAKNTSAVKAVRLLVVSNCLLFPEKQGSLHPLSQHKWMDTRTHENIFKDITMTFLEIPKCRVQYVKDIRDATDLWCYYFTQVHNASKQEIQSLETNFPIMKKALDPLFTGGWGEEKTKYYRHLADKHLADVHSIEQERLFKEQMIAEQSKKIEELKQQIEKDKELIWQARRITQLFKKRAEEGLNTKITDFDKQIHNRKCKLENEEKIIRTDDCLERKNGEKAEIESKLGAHHLTMDERIKELAIQSHRKHVGLNRDPSERIKAEMVGKNGMANLGKKATKYDGRILELDKEVAELNADIEGLGEKITGEKNKKKAPGQNGIENIDFSDQYELETLESKNKVLQNKSLELQTDIERERQIAELNEDFDWLGTF